MGAREARRERESASITTAVQRQCVACQCVCRVSVCVAYEWEGIGGLADAAVYVYVCVCVYVYVYDIDSCTDGMCIGGLGDGAVYEHLSMSWSYVMVLGDGAVYLCARTCVCLVLVRVSLTQSMCCCAPGEESGRLPLLPCAPPHLLSTTPRQAHSTTTSS